MPDYEQLQCVENRKDVIQYIYDEAMKDPNGYVEISLNHYAQEEVVAYKLSDMVLKKRLVN